MTHEEATGLLDDWVDDTLDGETRQDVCRHLEGCQACREEAAALRVFKQDLKALPKVMEPERDLWPGIAGRIGRDDARVLDLRDDIRSRSAAGMDLPTSWRLAAAAVLLVAVSSVVTFYLSRGPSQGRTATSDSRRSGPGADLVSLDVTATYAETIEQLRRTLEARRGDLSLETVREVRRNLDVIDEAIRASRAALETEPGDRELIRSVSMMYEEKIALLQNANDLPNGS